MASGRRKSALGCGGALSVAILLGLILSSIGMYRCFQDGRTAPPERQVRDVTQLYALDVQRVVRPQSVAELQQLLSRHEGPISLGGGRFSMGGQIATDGTLFIDLRELDEVVALDPDARTIRVQAGITWRKIQEAIDPHDLSIKIMQSYANFTVGGSLSVNAHGRYVGEGPVVHSVRSLDLVLADGQKVRASRTENPELFFAAIGGYGAIGAIAEVELALVENTAVERTVERMDRKDFSGWFERFEQEYDRAVFFNADLYPPLYDDLVAITFSETERPVTIPDRLQTPGASSAFDQFTYWWVSEGPLGKETRQKVIDRMRLQGKPVVWRNYEASYDARGLEPRSRERNTYVLQEYFVPLANFDSFAEKMSSILQQYDANVVNVSIRHASADPDTLLTWAPTEVFAFVLYYKQGTSAEEREEVGEWTQALIHAVLEEEGQYYLPYQIWASDEAFHQAYPRATELFALKQRFDPTYKLRNSLWDRYLPDYPEGPVVEPEEPQDPWTAPVVEAPQTVQATADDAVAEAPQREMDEASVRAELAKRPHYQRSEDQTFLTLPEWYIVYSADELGAHLTDDTPASFPWFDSVCQFCSLYGSVTSAMEGRYPFNTQYHGMIWVIGSSFGLEYGVRGVWEKTVGRVVSALSSGGEALDDFHAQLSRDYGDFVHHTPFYAFPWAERRADLAEVPGDGTLRGLERRWVIWAELFVKGAWSAVIEAGVTSSLEAQPDTVEAWVHVDRGPPEDVEGVVVLQDFGTGGLLLSVPRYEPFTATVPALIDRGVSFVEIAGGRTLTVQVVADSGWGRAALWGDVIARWPILTEPGRERIALEVPVDRLHEVLPALRDEPIVLEHLYDY